MTICRFFRDEKEFANFVVLSIYPMRHDQQEHLIRRWKSLSGADNGPSEESDGAIDQLENRLNGIILHNKIVPRFPFFILSILQTYEAFMPQGLRISAYAHCYQALITAQMIRSGIGGDDIDSAFNFLSHFAFHLFRVQRGKDTRSFDGFVKDYDSQYVILPGVFNRLVGRADGMLRRNGSECEFQYPFVFYYFLGYFFGTHPDDASQYIDELIEKSYLRDHMHILIFSIHHTHDGIIEKIVEQTMTAFGEAKVAEMLTEEMSELETALFEVPKDVLSGRTVQSERKAERERRDRVELATTDYVEESDDEVLNDVYRMLKNMEILGQILRNKYGSLKKERIENILTTIVDAGLRLVHTITSTDSIRGFDEFISERASELRSRASNKVHGSSQHTVEPDVLDELRQQFRALVVMTVYIILKKTAITVGKAELDGIIREVVRKRNTPAYELICTFFELGTADTVDTKLVDRIVDALRRRKRERNWVVRRLMSLETQMYLNTHSVKHNLRRKLFHELGLRYRPNLMSSEK